MNSKQERSDKFNLAYAAGFECMALGVGHWLVNEREYLFGQSDTRVASLILWHFVEEIEHKSVTLDVYNAVYGDYFYRIYGLFYATLHIIKHSRRAYKIMLKKDGLWNNLRSRWRLTKMILRFYKNMFTHIVDCCLPKHDPQAIEDPAWSVAWIKRHNDGDEDKLALLDTNKLHTAQPS